MPPTRSSRWPADVERSLSIAGTSTADSIIAGAREAQTTLVNASSEAAEHVKSLAADVAAFIVDGRRLQPPRSITAGAREAQTTLVTASSNAAEQVKS